MSRVQVQDLPDPERFRPTQPTGDTFGGAPRPIIDNNLERLSSALASFGSTLSAIGRRAPSDGKDLEAQYRQMRLAAGNGAAAGAVVSGQIPVLNHPRAGPVVAGQIGEDHARGWVEQQRQAIANGTFPLFGQDGRPTNIEEVWAQRAQEYYSTQPQRFQLRPGVVDPAARGFQMGAAALLDKAREEAITAQRAAVANESNALIDSSVTRFLSPIGEAAGRRDENGRFAVSDEQLAELWAKQRQEIRGFFTPQRPGRSSAESLIDYRRIENRTVGLLTDLAKDNPEAALRLMQLNRGRTPEGVELGPIIANPHHFERLRDVERSARARAMENFESRVLNGSAEEAARQLRAGNGAALQTMTDRTYENPWDSNPDTRTRTLSASRIRDAAYARAATQEETAIRQSGASPAATEEALFQSARRLYIQSNVVNPAWRSSINEAIRISGDPAALSDPANANKVRSAMELYQRLSREHPGYIKTLGINEDAETFFQRVAVLRDDMGTPEGRAMQEAAQSMQTHSYALDATARDRINSSARSLGSSYIPWLSAGGNEMEARDAISRVAERIMGQSGITPDAAVKKAVEVLGTRVTVLNGRSHIGDPNLSRESLPFWQSRLAQIVTESRALAGSDGAISDPTQLSVRRINNGGGYAVVDRNGVQVMAPTTDPRNPEGPPILRPVLIEPRSIQNAMENDRTARASSERAEIARQQQIGQLQRQLEMDDNARTGGRSSRQRAPLTPEQRAAVQAQLDDLRGPQGPATAPANPDAVPPSPTRSMPFGTQGGIVGRQLSEEPPERQVPPVQMPGFLQNLLRDHRAGQRRAGQR